MNPNNWRNLRTDMSNEHGTTDLPLDPGNLPIKEIARAIAERADELGLTWRLVPATVSSPGSGGVMRVVLDGDTTIIDAVSMIGRLPVGARVFVILTPPAGVHVVGFLGADFPPSTAGEEIGRTRMITTTADFSSTSNTLANVPGLTFNVVANATYEVRLRASLGGPVATDGAVAWTVPSGTLDRHVVGVHVGETNNFAASVMFMGRRQATDSQPSATFSGGGSGSTDFSSHWEDCLLRVGTFAGPVRVQFARFVAAGTAVFRANSYLTVQRYR